VRHPYFVSNTSHHDERETHCRRIISAPFWSIGGTCPVSGEGYSERRECSCAVHGRRRECRYQRPPSARTAVPFDFLLLDAILVRRCG